MTFLSYSDWSNFSVASVDAEKTFIGLGPGRVAVKHRPISNEADEKVQSKKLMLKY